jgi:hypothetical protein
MSSNQDNLTCKTLLICPRCGWNGNAFTAKHLSIIELWAIGILAYPASFDEEMRIKLANNQKINQETVICQHATFVEKFKNWDGCICPKCDKTKLIAINNQIYNENI